MPPVVATTSPPGCGRQARQRWVLLSTGHNASDAPGPRTRHPARGRPAKGLMTGAGLAIIAQGWIPGLERRAIDFYDGLEADNSKAYWMDHKASTTGRDGPDGGAAGRAGPSSARAAFSGPTGTPASARTSPPTGPPSGPGSAPAVRPAVRGGPGPGRGVYPMDARQLSVTARRRKPSRPERTSRVG